MENKKEEKVEKIEKKKFPSNMLEQGDYMILGPENGDIAFDKIELNAGSGAKRIWKVEEFGRERIVLKVIKFG